MEEETKKVGRPPSKVKCEVVRKIFIDGPSGHSIPVAPGELSQDQLMENAKRRKAEKAEIKPEKVFVELDRDVAEKLSDAGAVKVAL